MTTPSAGTSSCSSFSDSSVSSSKSDEMDLEGAPKPALSDPPPKPATTPSPKDKKPKKPKKVKKERKKSSYLFFNKEYRSVLAKENPPMSFAEASKLIGQKWKELSKEEREPYEKMAQEEQKKKELEKELPEKKEKKEKKEKAKKGTKSAKGTKKVSKKAASEGSPHPGVASKSPRPMHTFLPVQEIDVGKPPKVPKHKETTKKRMGTPYGIFLEKREKQLRAEYCERNPNATESDIESHLSKTFEGLSDHEIDSYVEEAKKGTKTVKKVSKRKKSTDEKEKPSKKLKTEAKSKKSSISELPHVPLPILPATPLSTSQERRRILFKRIEDPGYSQVFLLVHTKDELHSKITEKLKEKRKIINIIDKTNGDEIIINDDEDVQTLEPNSKLEVHFE